jgi:subtilisin family serine protease
MIRRILALFLACIAAGLWAQGAPRPTPPPEPPVKPFIVAPVDRDADGSRVDDRIERRVARARATLSRANATAAEKAAAQATLQQPTEVELVFERQITQEQIDAFLKAGGTIDHVFQRVSYGFTGRIAADKADSLPAAMGASLLGVVEKSEVAPTLDHATRNSRTRPATWNAGVDGNSAAPPNANGITIAILDTGVDGTHTDLSGRQQYWKDWTADNLPSAQDIGHHGTHVAGIAAGSGAAAGASPTSISFMTLGRFPLSASSFSPAPLYLQPNPINWTTTLRFATLTTATALVAIGFATGDGPSSSWSGAAGVSGTVSPIATTVSGVTNPQPGHINRWSPIISTTAGSNGEEYAGATSVSYAGLGDGYNVMRGVAPDTRWAGLKVFQDNGSGNTLDIGEALDDIVAQNSTHNIKVANLSLGVVGDPGLDATTRAKVNTGASNGIVMCVAAGNDGLAGTAAARQIDDPGRAHYCITVAASNDINQLTDYSNSGFPPGSFATGDGDLKPDLCAPGGSRHFSMIMAADSNNGDSLNNLGANFSDSVANNYYNISGTSMATPHVAGAAALVIDARQQAGFAWAYNLASTLAVKAILLATATETNQTREQGPSSNPTLDRGAKDAQEGYGMINVDAATELFTNAVITGPSISGLSDTFGSGPFDKRCWARRVQLTSGSLVTVNLDNPAGGDYDVYLYSATPDTYGNPVILASSTTAGAGVDHTLTYTPSATQVAYLVVKRVSGSGTWSFGPGSNVPVGITEFITE